MKAQDIRNLPAAELSRHIQDLRAQYYTLQETVRLGKERNHARLRQLRRDIARHIGVLRESK